MNSEFLQTINKLNINNFHHLAGQIKQGDMFIVHYPNDWLGKKKDNEYDIQRAIDNGAIAILIKEGSIYKNSNVTIIYAKNTYLAFRELALYKSSTLNLKRIIVTGSYGKTAFKLHLYQLLKDQINTYARLNSSNRVASLYGNLSSLKKEHELVILEIPVSTNNKTKRRASYVNPDIFVITSIGHEHIERHGSIENIVKAKCSIASSLKKNGLVIVPYDDEYFHLITKELSKYKNITLLTFGMHKSCNAQILASEFKDFSWIIKARIEDTIIEYKIPFIESHAPIASLAEFLCAYHLHVDIKKLSKKYDKCTNYKTSGKISIQKFNNKTFTLYDQSHRGGIEGYISFFKTLKNLKPKNNGKKILITSEFVDLEDNEQKFINYDEFKKLIKYADIDEIYSVENFDKISNVLGEKNLWKKHFKNISELKKYFYNIVGDNDIIATKGIFESNLPSFIKFIKEQVK